MIRNSLKQTAQVSNIDLTVTFSHIPYFTRFPMDMAVRLIWLLPAVLGILLVFKSRRKHLGSTSLPLPPGPSLFQATKDIITTESTEPWHLFAKWNKRYGKLTYIKVPGQRVLLIDSRDVIRDLLEKRSSKYSGRPETPTMALYGWSFTTSLLPHNAKWRQHRRFYQHGLRPEIVLKWQPFQLQNARTLLSNLLTRPDQFVDHVATFTASTITAALYGYTTLPHDDPLLDIVNRAIAIFLESTTVVKIVIFTTFSFLKHLPTWLPGLGFYRKAAVSRELARKMLDTPFEISKRSVVEGSGKPSLVSDFLSQPAEKRLLDEDIIKEVAASGMSAGLETTSSSLVIFFLAMAMHPSVQERAHQEIESVIGTDRLPNFEDRPSLPYVEAVLRETLRWLQASPIGAPHATTEDDTYNGFFIPKKTIIQINVWAMAHDESIYADPYNFDPSRFFTPDGKLNDDNLQYVFGFGRRICPGRHLAEASLWIAVASLLSAFNIRKARNEKGEEIEIVPKFTGGQVVRPAPFLCEITPRRPELEKLIGRTKLIEEKNSDAVSEREFILG